jgi:hypothetical protein
MWLKPQEAHEIKVSLLKRELLLTVFLLCECKCDVTYVKLHAAGRYQTTRYASPDIEPIHTYKHPEV